MFKRIAEFFGNIPVLCRHNNGFGGCIERLERAVCLFLSCRKIFHYRERVGFRLSVSVEKSLCRKFSVFPVQSVFICRFKICRSAHERRADVGAVTVKRELPADNRATLERSALRLSFSRVIGCAAYLYKMVVNTEHPTSHGAVVEFTEVFVVISVVFIVGRSAVFGYYRGNIEITLVETLYRRDISRTVPSACHFIFQVLIDEHSERNKPRRERFLGAGGVSLGRNKAVYFIERICNRLDIHTLTESVSLD